MSDTSQGNGWWQASDGKWYAPTVTEMQVQAPEPFLFAIGDIGVSRSWIVTRSGNVPIEDAQITIADHTIRSKHTPGIIIVLVVLFIWVFLLSLLLLLIKQERVTGSVMVTVTGPGFYHVSHLPIYGATSVMLMHRNVDQANAMIHAARQARA